MKTIIATMLAAAVSLQVASAQNISGKISNNEKQPVEFANVILLTADSVFVTGTISDFDGKFSVERPIPRCC